MRFEKKSLCTTAICCGKIITYFKQLPPVPLLDSCYKYFINHYLFRKKRSVFLSAVRQIRKRTFQIEENRNTGIGDQTSFVTLFYSVPVPHSGFSLSAPKIAPMG